MRGRLWLLAGVAVALGACGEGADAGESPAVASGRAVYRNVCVVCHHADPTERGNLGPPVAGASLELLQAKVVHGSYPPGYTPKEGSQVMPVYAYVEPKIADLAAYLAQAAEGSP